MEAGWPRPAIPRGRDLKGLGSRQPDLQRRTRSETQAKAICLWWIVELMRLTRIELCDLAARITNRLPDYPGSSQAYVSARKTLRNIRRLLARRDPGSG
jgi:hypothetical protein